jgi:hypothetical protein
MKLDPKNIATLMKIKFRTVGVKFLSILFFVSPVNGVFHVFN